MDVHDLTPAYALDALDDVEREEYEAHLAQCERCRKELAELSESAAALAWAVESPLPPAALRNRILDEAAAGRDNVVPLVRRRQLWQGISAVAACAAVGLGIWAASLQRSLHNERAVRSAMQIVLDPASRKVHMPGAFVALSRQGEGVLVVNRVPAAPAGKTYEAWVIPRGGRPERAGVFHGKAMLKLAVPVEHGSRIAVTVERDGGTDAPTTQPVMSTDV